ncbi:zona pellucida sperm-binding protein 3-like isoform X2 [Halichoeres trimaculatus]|uniref:zona pellucida sperm-binding protein 3-like isoform X2 n=1 Tax=Halichoeres trimaculatus TaxID=147232 RepID=UPI003D9DFF17
MTSHGSFLICVTLVSGVLSVRGLHNDEKTESSDSSALDGAGLELKCGEVNMIITVKRSFFDASRTPFELRYLRLGANSTLQKSCEPTVPQSNNEMVISAGLLDCGTESKVHGDWLVFSNQLLLFPPKIPVSTGSVIVKGTTTVIPVECYYKRMQLVDGDPITPTWLPMTSTVSAFGLLHFSLQTMEGDCSSVRSSSVYQQGEAVFLEAGIEAPFHPSLSLYVDYCAATLKPDPLSLPSYKFIIKHGCLMDSVLPGSSSQFLPRKQNNRLCFSVQVPQFNNKSEEQMFITCHLKATLKQNAPSHLNKACSFNTPTFRWRSADGDDAPCECCGFDNCFRYTEEGNSGTGGHRLPLETGP